MGVQANLSGLDRPGKPGPLVEAARLLLPLGWVSSTIGYYGPWIAHPTAALTLSGADMGEFVKFLPGVLDGSLGILRQAFYLPPFAIAVSVALLIGSQQLHYPWLLRAAMLLLAVPVSLQLLPPAWSPSSLLSAEFRVQTLALGICWLLLVGSWLLGHLSPWFAGLLSGALCLAAIALTVSQFLAARPAIDLVYHTRVAVGWGFGLCMAGLATLLAGSILLMLGTRAGSRGS